MKGYWIDKESGRVEATYADLSGIVDKNESRDPYGVPTGSVPRASWTVAYDDSVPVTKDLMSHSGPVNATQVGGTHYSKLSIQPWAAMEAWMSPEQFKGYLRGNVVKYIARCDDKGGKEDILKAKHYIDKLLEAYGDGMA